MLTRPNPGKAAKTGYQPWQTPLWFGFAFIAHNISLSGTPPVLLKGLDFEREWRDRLSQKIGIPVISQMEPHARALLAMGVRRVAIATYYGDELNHAIVDYFRRFDIEGVVLGEFQHASSAGQALYTTSLKALDDVSYIEVYQ